MSIIYYSILTFYNIFLKVFLIRRIFITGKRLDTLIYLKFYASSSHLMSIFIINLHFYI